MSEDEATHKRVWISKDHPDGIAMQEVGLAICEHDKEEAYQDLIEHLLANDEYDEVMPEHFHTMGFYKSEDDE